ncbi:MAG: guanine deaminase [Comamonadaceae bacterium]|nr:MAG: guanine deaminase [Comamonadaceae bacterium]
MKAYRSSILYFSPAAAPQASAVLEDDGLLVVGPNAQGRQVVLAVGPYRELQPRFADLAVTHWPGRIIAPGFVDLHSHYPQTNVIGSPAEGLLPWLENYTFPEEKRFSSPEYSAQEATFFIAELLRHGVTTALTFATSHSSSVNALFQEAQQQQMRLITGLCLMDRHAPVDLLNQRPAAGLADATEQSLIDSENLLQRWHGVDRLGYAITPRFAPTSTDAQLRGAGELAARYPEVWIQSHVAENKAEIAWARELFPASRSYLATYADFGLMRQRAVYAHCIHFDDEDRALMRSTGAAAAISPTSNLFLGTRFTRCWRRITWGGKGRAKPVCHSRRNSSGGSTRQVPPKRSGWRGWWATCCRAAKPILSCSTPKPRRCWPARRRWPITWTSCCFR